MFAHKIEFLCSLQLAHLGFIIHAVSSFISF